MKGKEKQRLVLKVTENPPGNMDDLKIRMCIRNSSSL